MVDFNDRRKPPSYGSMDEVKAAHAAAGKKFFEPESMKFFNSRVGNQLHGGRYFVTSEQPPGEKRGYTVREASHQGKIDTVGDFMEHQSRGSAVRKARQLAKEAEQNL